MRSGVRLALDIGDVRIGVASSDPHGILATPVETIRRSFTITAPTRFPVQSARRRTASAIPMK